MIQNMELGILPSYIIVVWCVVISALTVYSIYPSSALRTNSSSITNSENWTKNEVLLLLFLILLGFAIRAYDLINIPIEIHNDEASVGIFAKKWIHNSPYVFGASWSGLPELSYLVSSLSMSIFEESYWGLRIGSVFFGTLSLLGIYLLTRLLFGKSAAIFSIALCIPFHWHFHLSRTGHHYIQTVFVFPWGLFLFLKSISVKSKKISIFAGLFTGFAVHMYFASRLLPIIQVVLFLFILIKDDPKERKQTLICGLFWILSFIIFILPSAYYFIYHLPEFGIRTKQVSIWNDAAWVHITGYTNSSNWLDIFQYQIKNAFGIFIYRGDSSLQYGRQFPFVNAILFIPFIASLIVAIKNITSLKWVALLTTLFLTVMCGAVLTIDPPFSPRISGLASIIPIFIGALFACLSAQYKNRIIPIFVWIIIISAGASDLYWYKSHYLKERIGLRRDQIVRILDKDRTISQVINLFPEEEYYRYESYQFLGNEITFREGYGINLGLLLEDIKDSRTLFISPDPLPPSVPIEKSEFIQSPYKFYASVSFPE